MLQIPLTRNRLTKMLSPKQFIRLLNEDRDSIKTTRFIPPKPGTNSLGNIIVEYRYAPTYKSSKAKKSA